jgi:hypothetical protein
MERGRERERIWIPKFQTIGLPWFNPWFTSCLTHVNICHVNPWLAAFPKWSWPRCFLPVGRRVAQSRRLDPCSGRGHAWGTRGAGTGPNMGISAVGQWMIWMEPGLQTGCSYIACFFVIQLCVFLILLRWNADTWCTTGMHYVELDHLCRRSMMFARLPVGSNTDVSDLQMWRHRRPRFKEYSSAQGLPLVPAP